MKEQTRFFLWLQLFTACLVFGVNGKLPLSVLTFVLLLPVFTVNSPYCSDRSPQCPVPWLFQLSWLLASPLVTSDFTQYKLVVDTSVFFALSPPFLCVCARANHTPAQVVPSLHRQNNGAVGICRCKFKQSLNKWTGRVGMWWVGHWLVVKREDCSCKDNHIKTTKRL